MITDELKFCESNNWSKNEITKFFCQTTNLQSCDLIVISLKPIYLDLLIKR